jgi:LPS sulfotransferase NodH
MHRRDTTRQAVSLWKALQTQQWRKDSDEDVGGQGLRFSFAAVDHLKLRIDEHNAAWQDFFDGCGVEPMEVVYEDLVEDYRGRCYGFSMASGSPSLRISPSQSLE